MQLQINGIGYSGALGALTLAAGTPPAWTITGGTATATLTGTATIGFGGFNHGHGGWHDDRRNSLTTAPAAAEVAAQAAVAATAADMAATRARVP